MFTEVILSKNSIYGPTRISPRQSGNSVNLGVLFILLAGSLLPLGLAIYTGSIAIPHNDTWAYSKIAQTFAETGQIRLLGWNRSALVGQFVILGPLAASLTLQQATVSLLAAAALVATFVYMQKRVSPRLALFGVALIAAMPDFGLLSTSFMTDIPLFAATMISLVIVDRAIARESLLLFLTALVMAAWAITIREQGLVVLGTVVVTAARTLRGRSRISFSFALLAVGVAIIAFEFWRRAQPFDDPPALAFAPTEMMRTVVLSYFTFGLYILPVIALVFRPARMRISAYAAMAAAAGTGATVAALHGTVLLSSYLNVQGAYFESSVGHRNVFPSWFAWVFTILGILGGSALAGLLAHGAAQLDVVSASAGSLFVVVTLGQTILGQGPFARYLLLGMPFMILAVLRPARSLNRYIGIGTLASLAVVSLVLTCNVLAFDAARWKAGNQLVAEGWAATDIDAGLEWVGYHATTPAHSEPGWENSHPQALGRFMPMFPRSRECVLVAASPHAGLQEIDRIGYKSFIVTGDSWLWVYRHPKCR